MNEEPGPYPFPRFTGIGKTPTGGVAIPRTAIMDIMARQIAAGVVNASMFNSIQEHLTAPAKRRWYSIMGWPSMLLLAWLLFELTTDFVPCAVVACAKFGWNDLLTALWLWRTDSQRSRGWVCFWFYAASALWKVSVSAFVAIFAIVLVEAFQQGGQPGPQDPSAEFIAVGLESMVGFVVSTLITLLAIFLAWRHHMRVWVDAGVHEARRCGVWPPIAFCRVNRAYRLTITALTIASCAVSFSTFCAAAVAIEPLMKGHDELTAMLTFAAMMFGMFVLAGTILTLNEWVARNVIAAAPRQCWPEGTELAFV